MKPITLKFNGINCFDSEQTIDFNKLGGIFGIFGPTGSGKTTILDAISIAFFGETPRLGGKNYEFINNKTKVCSVELLFECEKEYLIRREYKIKNKNVESSASLMQGANTIAEGTRDVNAKILDIIKMTASDYSKCIALPQGEFAAFLKSSAAERTALVGKLFGLEEYGDILTKNANSKKALLEQKCLLLSEQISSMGENVQSELNILAEAEQTTINNVSASDAKLKVLTEKFEEQQKKNIEYKNYDNLINQHNYLLNQAQEIEKKRALLQNHNLVFANKSLLLQLKQQQLTLAENNTKLEQVKRKYELASFDLNAQNRLLEELNNKAKTIKGSQDTILELKELEEREKTILKLNEDTLDAEKKIKSENELIANIDGQISTEEELEYKDTNRLDELNISFQNIQDKINGLEENGGSFDTKIRIYEDVLKVATDEYQNLKDENSKLTKQILQNNTKIEAATASADSIIFKLCLDKNIDDAAGEKEKLLFKLKSITNQLAFIAQQKSNIEIEKSSNNNKIEKLSGEIAKFDNEIKRLENCKSTQIQKIKEIEKERDLNLIQEAESSVASETEICSPCPICGNIVNNIFPHKNSNATYYNNALSLAKKEQIQIDLQIKELEIKKENAKFKVSTLESSTKDYEKSISSLNKLQNKVLLEFVDATENQLNDFNNLLEKTEQDLKILYDAKEKISQLKDESKLLSSQNEKIGIYIQKNNENADILFTYCEKLRKNIAECEFFLLQDANYSPDIKELKQTMFEKHTIVSKQIVALTKEIEQHKSNIQVLKQKKIHCLENIDVLKERIATNLGIKENFDQDFERLCHGFDSVKDKISKVISAKESIEEEVAKISESVKNLTIESLQAKHEFDLLQNTTKLNSETILNLQQNLENVFACFGTKDIDSLLLNVLSNPQEIAKQISDYDYSLQANAEELKKTNIPEERDNTNYRKLIDEETSLKNSYIEKLGAIKEQINAKRELQSKQNILKDELEIERKNLSTITQLCSLIRGKEFLAFASEIYLQDITQKASTKLFSLLSGRYSLCYENKEFFVLDNFNNGAKRSCLTLSGGETFVVSLSLALSISETILAHAAQKSEFFFLDEGFGTLDSSLRDNIIDSLIKLNESGITIGLITHVEDLKSEIKNRLIVEQCLDDTGKTLSKIRFEQDI